MQILVTGGAGYIGSHTAKLLAGAGFEPVVFDSLVRGRRETVRWGPLVEASLDDRAALEAVFREYSIGAVIHFAAFAYVGESMRAPETYFRNNVVNTIHLLDAMKQAGIRQIIFSSSCASYGHPQEIPISEDHPQQPVNPYGESKLLVERILRWYGEIDGLKWISLRYFNAAGADPGGELGELHEPETHLIPLAISAALGATPCLDIYGTDYDTPDGTAIRDYLHVSDIAAAHLAALRYLQSGGSSGSFNLGTGEGHSVREVVAAVERVSGRRVAVREAGRRQGDPAALIALVSKAREILGWRAGHSTLDEIARTAWNWHSKLAGHGANDCSNARVSA